MAGPLARGKDIRGAFRLAAIRATLAPSVHNTQPWRLALSENGLQLFADRSRQLTVLDPTRRQLLVSCGCALFNARVQLAAASQPVTVLRLPDPDDADLLAVLSPGDGPADPDGIGALNRVVETRQTNRRRFSDEQVPAPVVAELVAAAAAEDSGLFVISDEAHRISTAVLSQRADAEQNANPGYRAELRAWTSDDPTRRDGVPATAVPHVAAGSGDDIPIRDFDARGTGWLPTETRSSMRQCLLLLTTDGDEAAGWLRAGEALERLWLVATAHGYAVSPLTQVVEVAHTRQRLRAELGLTAHPVVLLRVGRAPITASSHRRRLAEVLVES